MKRDEPLTPEERALAERLRPGRQALPSADLDARILAAARAAVASTPATSAPPHDADTRADTPSTPTTPAPAAASGQTQSGATARRRRRRWPAWTGLAASLTLAAGIAWQLRTPPPPTAAPMASSPVAEDAATETAAQGSNAASPAGAADAASASDAAAARTRTAPSPSPSPQPPAAPPAPAMVAPLEQVSTTAARVPKRAAAAAPPAETPPQPEPAPSIVPQAPPAPPPAPAPAPAMAAAPPPEQPDALAKPAVPSSVQQQDDRMRQARRSVLAERASDNATRQTRDADASAATVTGDVARDQVDAPMPAAAPITAETLPLSASGQAIVSEPGRAAAVQDDARLSPRKWLARVRERRDAGDEATARASLQRFQREHPHARIPKDLRALLEE